MRLPNLDNNDLIDPDRPLEPCRKPLPYLSKLF